MSWWDDMSHRLAAKTLIFLTLLGALWWNQHSGQKHALEETRVLSEQTHVSLCAFKLDLRSRYNDGVDYVRQVQSGEREIIPGITLAEIQRSLANQKATLDSLSALDCSS